MRLTDSGWPRSGVTDGGRGERVREGGVGEGEGEEVGVGVVGSVVVGESQEIEDGGSPAHSCISLINSQSVLVLILNVMTMSSGFCGRVNVFLVSVLVVEEKEQF